MTLASEHRYVVWASTPPSLRSRSVCIACGRPPYYHGDSARHPKVALDYDAVELISCESVDPETQKAKIAERPLLSLLDYADEVFGVHGSPSADKLIDKAASLGCVLFLRSSGDVGITHGETVDDDLLRGIRLAHRRIKEVLTQRARAMKGKA